jgi:hypothetical protein
MKSTVVAPRLYDLLRLDLGDWEPQDIYETEALVKQKQHSLRGLDAWIEGMLQKDQLPVPYSLKYPNRCLTDHLVAEAKQFDRYTNETLVPTKLKETFSSLKHFNNQVSRGWIFPPLSECRAAWERCYGGKWNWIYQVKDWQWPSF